MIEPTMATTFKYIGKFNDLSEIASSEYGNVCIIDDTGYVYNDEWIELGKTITISPCESELVHVSGRTPIDIESHIIQITACPQCNAPLPLKNIDNNGLCQCEYCNSMISVYLKH